MVIITASAWYMRTTDDANPGSPAFFSRFLGRRRKGSSTYSLVLGLGLFRPTLQLFPCVNRHGPDSNGLEILKYPVSVPKVPGSYHGESSRSSSPPSTANYQDLFSHHQRSIKTLIGNYLEKGICITVLISEVCVSVSTYYRRL
jgi:hypothetical protein